MMNRWQGQGRSWYISLHDMKARPDNDLAQPSNADVTKADYEALAAFRHELRRFSAFSEQAAREAGLSPQQHQALLAIKGASGRDTLTVGEIAAALLIRPNSAVELVDRLVYLRLAERRPDPEDQRRVQVALTARAEDVLRSLAASHLEELRTARPSLLALLSRLES
jgi:DNA-binding MarR family transcriptional regulator